MKFLSGRNYIYAIGLIIILINILLSNIHLKWDITDQKRFTLTQSTMELLKKVDKPIEITVFLDGSVKASDKKFVKTINELLLEYRSYASENMSIVFANPFTLSKDDSTRVRMIDSLGTLGITPYTLRVKDESVFEENQKVILPGCIIKIGNRQKAINFFNGIKVTNEQELFARAEALLEYKLSSNIEKMIEQKPPKIYFSSSHNEPMDIRMIDFFQTVAQRYTIDTLNLRKAQVVPNDADILVVFFPSTKFTNEEKLNIDHFIMNGGKAMFVISTVAIENSQQSTSGDLLFINQDVGIEDLLFQYGCRVEGSLVKDLQCATLPIVVGQVGDKPQINSVDWPYYPLLNPNPNHVITKNLDPVLSKYTTWIDTLKNTQLSKIVLLSSSNKTQVVGIPRAINLSEAQQLDPILFTRQQLPVAVLIEGSFPSLFYNRISPNERAAIKQKTGKSFLRQSLPTSIVVIANPQIMINEVNNQGVIPMGYVQDMSFSFSNKSFLINSLAYLANPNGIIEARSKDFSLQLLDSEKIINKATFWKLFNILTPLVLLSLLGTGIFFVRLKRR